MMVGSGGGFVFQNCVDILFLVPFNLVPALCLLLVNLFFFEDLVCLLTDTFPPWLLLVLKIPVLVSFSPVPEMDLSLHNH